MEFAVKAVKAADTVLNAVITIAVILALLFAGSALWDTLAIYNDAGIDSRLLRYKPTANGGSNPSLAELMVINPDVCGWLTVDDTNIDYPVVRGSSNSEYINKNVYREFALSGSIFLDYRNQPDFSDFYSLLYGHHMDGGVMFGDLARFVESTYFAGHKTGILYLPQATYQIEFFACLSVDAYDKIVFAPGANDEGQASVLLSYITEHALQYRELDLAANGRIIGLSTCSGAATNGRTLVYGQLTKIKTSNQEGGS